MQADEAIQYLLGTLPADPDAELNRTQQAIADLRPLADAFASATDEPEERRADPLALQSLSAAMRYAELSVLADQDLPTLTTLFSSAHAIAEHLSGEDKHSLQAVPDPD